jgi:type III secretory pathway component EscU
MTEYEKECVFSICAVLVSALVVGFMLIGAGMLDYTLKTNNYQTALKMITECRVQTHHQHPKANLDAICGKIPTWEQYK